MGFLFEAGAEMWDNNIKDNSFTNHQVAGEQ